MSRTVKIHYQKLEAKIKALNALVPQEVARPLVLSMVERWGMFMDRASPVDTGRYRNGWAMALRDVGLGHAMPVKPLRSGAFVEWQENKMEWQANYAQRQWLETRYAYTQASKSYNKRYGNGQRPGLYERGARRRLQALGKLLKYREKVLERARQEHRFWLETEGKTPALVIFGRGPKTLRNGRKDPSLMLQNLVRIITKVYGGKGRVVSSGHDVIVSLGNHEPHASIVESRHFVAGMARDFAAVGTGGVNAGMKMTLRRSIGVAAEKSGLKVGKV